MVVAAENRVEFEAAQPGNMVMQKAARMLGQSSPGGVPTHVSRFRTT
jgi:hypothetical protein